MKNIRKVLSVLLCVVLCIGIMPASFADGQDTYSIVAVGDSTTNGFNLDDYGYYSDASFMLDSSYNAYGFLDLASKDSYPYRMQRYLSEKMPGVDVQVTNLSVRGMRSDEIRKILDPSFENDEFGKAFMAEMNYAFKTCFGFDAHEIYTEKISGADLITLDCCMNNFSDYLISRVIACVNGDAEEMAKYADSASDITDRMAPGTEELVEASVAKVFTALSGVLPDGIVKQIADAVGYCFCDFCANFSAIIRMLRELNPTARIIVGGSFCPFDGLVLEYNGIEIDAGELFSALMGAVDTYMTRLDPNRDYYSFAKAPETETFMSVLARADGTDDLPQVLFERLVTSIYHERQMKLLGVMNEKIIAEAANRGVDSSGFGIVNDKDVFAAYEAVKAGTPTEKDQIIYDLTEDFLGLLLKAARVNKVDVQSLIGSLSGDMNVVAADMIGTPFEKLTPAQVSLLHIVDLIGIGEGLGIHPSYKGAEQKFEAFKKAYDGGRPAMDEFDTVKKETAEHTLKTLLVAFTSPILNAIEKAFSSFSFADFFSGTVNFFRGLIGC